MNLTIENTLSQIQTDSRDLLTAGLAVLAKDYAAYLKSIPRTDANTFERVFREFEQEETASYGGSPYFETPSQTGIPSGFAQQADSGTVDVTSLNDPSIEHEWTRIPGDRLLRRFGKEFRGVICGSDGPHEQFQKGLLGQATLPRTIAASILTAGFAGATFWTPLAVYIALLVIKAGLQTYCNTGDVG
ncbi:MAG: hypothetical protein QM796_17610 [Chthoniobacteraceae bacterium]